MAVAVKSDGRVDALFRSLVEKGFDAISRDDLDAALDSNKLRQCGYRTLCGIQAGYIAAFDEPHAGVHRKMIDKAHRSAVVRKDKDKPAEPTAKSYGELCADQYGHTGVINAVVHRQIIAAAAAEYPTLPTAEYGTQSPRVFPEFASKSPDELMAELLGDKREGDDDAE